MRRRVASSFFLSFLPVLLALACSTDDSSFFPPMDEELVIVPGPGDYDLSPSISRDARALVWVRVIDAATGVVMRWERPAEPETLLIHGGVVSADVSADGERVVAHIRPDSLWVWDRADSVMSRWLQAAPGFSDLNSPRWMDEDHVLISALGPEGRGIWTWDIRQDALAPLCTRFPDGVFDWEGGSPGIDRSGDLFCMVRRAGESCVGSLATCEIVAPIEGNAPVFWTIDPDEEDGILYIDSSNDLVGERRAIPERFVLMGSIFAFDVSSDGRWVLVWAARPAGRRLVLRDLRGLR